VVGSPPLNRTWTEIDGRRLCKLSLIFDAGLLNQDKKDIYTSLNPASIAYELIPYSFVVDWFVNIGGYLRSLETALLNQTAFIGGYSSELLAYDCKFNARGRSSTILREAFGTVSYSRFDRTLINSYPLPRYPKFEIGLGSSQMLSAAALFAQFLKR
jgi:hypothetical protein